MFRISTFLAALTISLTAWSQPKCGEIFLDAQLTNPFFFKWKSKDADGRDFPSADFSDLIKLVRKPVLQNIRFKAKKIPLGSVPWNGPDDLKRIYFGMPNGKERFEYSSLEFHKERGREPLEVILMTHLHLGMERGAQKIFDLPETKELESIYENRITEVWTDKTMAARTEALINKILSEREKLFAQDPLGEDARNMAAVIEIMEGYYQMSPKSPDSRSVAAALKQSWMDAQEQGFRVWLRSEGAFIGLFSSYLSRSQKQAGSN